MKFNTLDIVDGCLMLFGLTVSIQDIQSVLSIIIIIIDILWIIGKFMVKFFQFIKDGHIDENEKAELYNDAKGIKEHLDNIKDKEGDK